ncbi:YigZ family protein [Tenericutes bacterium MO-XQ]|nr:YigZ family protein [Tenericutes bacterium MO-XQ]
MNYIKEIITHQIVIDKSIFIGILFPLDDPSNIKDLIEEAKMMFPKANHYCSASLYGEGLEHATSSDDGEPQRTAGIPILEVLKHNNITNVLCVVVRYFGGIKLGAGGLIRAYAKATSEVLKTATFYEKKEMEGYKITFDYALISKVDHILEDISIIKDKVYLEDVSYQIYFKEKDISVFDEIKHQFKSIESLPFETLWIKI